MFPNQKEVNNSAPFSLLSLLLKFLNKDHTDINDHSLSILQCFFRDSHHSNENILRVYSLFHSTCESSSTQAKNATEVNLKVTDEVSDFFTISTFLMSSMESFVTRSKTQIEDERFFQHLDSVFPFERTKRTIPSWEDMRFTLLDILYLVVHSDCTQEIKHILSHAILCSNKPKTRGPLS